MDSYLDSNRLLVRKTGPIRLALVGFTAGRLADKIRLDCKILKIFYRLNYLDFYLVYSSAILLIVLEVHFGMLFSNNTYFRVYFVVCKVQSPFFSCRSLLLGTSIPNDNYNVTQFKWHYNHMHFVSLAMYILIVSKIINT